MTARNNLLDLVQRISIGDPCSALLVGGKQIALPVDSQGNGETDAGGDDLPGLTIGGDFDDGAGLAGQVVMGDAGFVGEERIAIILAAAAIIKIARAVDRDA